MTGPIEVMPLLESDDVVSEDALVKIKAFMKANGGDSIGFSMLALVPRPEDGTVEEK